MAHGTPSGRCEGCGALRLTLPQSSALDKGFSLGICTGQAFPASASMGVASLLPHREKKDLCLMFCCVELGMMVQVVPALGKPRQESPCGLKISLGYGVGSWPAWTV